MKIILNILTHGDETLGIEVAKEVSKWDIPKGVLSIQRANEKAHQLRKRFVDQDLNRSFPGKKRGNHEEHLAYKLLPLIKAADVVIDIHSTTSKLKDAIIVTKLDQKTLQCIKAMQPKYVLIMNATKNNALISAAKIGIAFEYGRNGEKNTLNKITSDIARLFHFFGITEMKRNKKKTPTTYFAVTKTVPKPKGFSLLPHIQNYQLLRKGEAFARNANHILYADEDFYPILFGQENYDGYFGFKGKQKIHTKSA